MITIADRVKTWIHTNPSYIQPMRQGVINYSSLARHIKPELERESGERLSVEAITLALNRAAKKLNSDDTVDYAAFIGEVSVQSGLGVLTIPQTDIDAGSFFRAARKLHEQNEYMVYTRGIWYTALIGKLNVIDELVGKLHGTITSRDIVGITIKLRIGHLPVPGVCAYVLQQLAQRDINLIEVTSSHNELTVFVPSKFTNAALACFL